jgi:acetylglutamate kinase
MAAARRSPPCSRLGIKSEFAAGLRVTDAPTMEIVEMVLAGSINKSIVSHINEAGGKAVGLCGKDGNMVTATKATRTMVDPGSNIEKVVDLGFVGEPDKVDLTLLNQLIGYELIPVLAPLASSTDGKTYNVNADTFAGAVAGALKAKRLLLLTDVPGVLDKSKKLIPELSIKDARKLIADGTISGGMIPRSRPASIRWKQASKAWSSSTARHPMRSCSNCSPIRARER